MAPTGVRALHWVFKVADRSATMDFFNRLGCSALRHEEFEEGCQASCNGPYDGKWSKTMIGYGDEDTNFVLELTYNYGVKHYSLGNDYNCITIRSQAAWRNLVEHGFATGQEAQIAIAAPDGYKFVIQQSEEGVPSRITEVAINVTDLQQSLGYWETFLGFEVLKKSDEEATLCASPDQCKLRLVQLPEGQQLKRAAAFGRIAYACSGDQLKSIEAECTAQGYTVLTPYVSLDTPGKATVEVVILADPDGHEICFVGEEGFSELSKVDPNANKLLADAMANDHSKEWFEKKNMHARKNSFVKC